MERPAVIRGKAQPAQPVTIPYDPRKDSESPQFIPYFPYDGNYTVQPVTPAQPSGPQLTGFTAPEPRGLQTPHGEVTPMQMREIKRLHDLQWSNSRIEKHVFNQENAGGVAYYKVKAVLDFYANGGAANGT